MNFIHVGPQFAVKDVGAAIEFYREVMGFTIDHQKGSPPSYAVVNSGEVYIHLCRQEAVPYPIGPGCCFICVSDVDLLWAQVSQSRGVTILQPLEQNDFGTGILFKGFVIQDPDRNTLRVNQPLIVA